MMEYSKLLTTDARSEKMDIIYSAMCDKTIADAKCLASIGKLSQALDTLLMHENRSRRESDVPVTSRLLVAIVKLCFQAKEWELLNEHIFLLKKKKIIVGTCDWSYGQRMSYVH